MARTRPRGPRPLDRRQPTPLWAQLADDLRRRIAAAEFPDTFPAESDLVGEYRVSRHTVREALRRLREQGLVSAHRGRPSRVTGGGQFELPMGTLYSLFRVVEAQGARPRNVVRALRTVVDPVAAARLERAPDARLVYLERLRLADEEPFALDRAWLPGDLAAPLLHADLSRTGLYDELASRCGLRPDSGGEQVHAAVPSAPARRLLGLPPGTAVFRIERIARVGGRPVEWRDSLVRADRYRLTVDWRPAAGMRLDVVAVPGGRAPRAAPRAAPPARRARRAATPRG